MWWINQVSERKWTLDSEKAEKQRSGWTFSLPHSGLSCNPGSPGGRCFFLWLVLGLGLGLGRGLGLGVGVGLAALGQQVPSIFPCHGRWSTKHWSFALPKNCFHCIVMELLWSITNPHSITYMCHCSKLQCFVHRVAKDDVEPLVRELLRLGINLIQNYIFWDIYTRNSLHLM